MYVQDLLDWYQQNKRDFVWRFTKDPYKIWVCEIVFQQTRINQGMSYYKRIIEKFPTVYDLANATEEEVLFVWQGLGYYSRARNLHATAKKIVSNYNGIFPNTYNELLTLKGVGPYTAAAIASICYDEKVPALDGNAFRVYSRVYNSYRDIADLSTRKYFFSYIQEKMPSSPGDFNQAIMELGALICTPKPQCSSCPILPYCKAYEKQTIHELPVKSKKIPKKDEVWIYYVCYSDTSLLLHKRNSGIWRGLVEFSQAKPKGFEIEKKAEVLHKLTHKNLHIQFHTCKMPEDTLQEIQYNDTDIQLIAIADYKKYAYPVPIKNFLDKFLPFQ